MDTLFEAAWHVAQAPTWLGWSLIGGGACGLSFLAGARLYA